MASGLLSQTAMNTRDLDTRCGYCEGEGYRQITGGVWLSAPPCPDCGGVGFLVTSPDAERLLAFVERHLGTLLRGESDKVHAGLASASMQGAACSPAH
jgi:hypothetical protein